MKTKKILTLVVILVLICVFSACAKNNTNTSADFDTVTYNEVKNLHDSLYNQEENVGDQQATSGFFTCALAPSTKKYLF